MKNHTLIEKLKQNGLYSLILKAFLPLIHRGKPLFCVFSPKSQSVCKNSLQPIESLCENMGAVS
jgi:hypothetical protein